MLHVFSSKYCLRIGHGLRVFGDLFIIYYYNSDKNGYEVSCSDGCFESGNFTYVVQYHSRMCDFY